MALSFWLRISCCYLYRSKRYNVPYYNIDKLFHRIQNAVSIWVDNIVSNNNKSNSFLVNHQWKPSRHFGLATVFCIQRLLTVLTGIFNVWHKITFFSNDNFMETTVFHPPFGSQNARPARTTTAPTYSLKGSLQYWPPEHCTRARDNKLQKHHRRR